MATPTVELRLLLPLHNADDQSGITSTYTAHVSDTRAYFCADSLVPGQPPPLAANSPLLPAGFDAARSPDPWLAPTTPATWQAAVGRAWTRALESNRRVKDSLLQATQRYEQVQQEERFARESRERQAARTAAAEAVAVSQQQEREQRQPQVQRQFAHSTRSFKKVLSVSPENKTVTGTIDANRSSHTNNPQQPVTRKYSELTKNDCILRDRWLKNNHTHGPPAPQTRAEMARDAREYSRNVLNKQV